MGPDEGAGPGIHRLGHELAVAGEGGAADLGRAEEVVRKAWGVCTVGGGRP